LAEQKYLAPKKLLGENYFGAKNLLAEFLAEQKHLWLNKHILTAKKCLGKTMFSRKMFGRNFIFEFWPKTFLIETNCWG
jgi:hypothetical protein